MAWRPVLLLAGALALVHGISSAWYGTFGDELYFLAAGRHLAWGYADQPPLVPWLAAALDHLAPGNLVVLRLPATLVSAGHVVLAALLAREMGERRRAQLLTGAAVAISPFFLATGHLLATSTLDPVLWTLLLWLVVRWVRTGNGTCSCSPPARCSRWPCSTSSSCPSSSRASPSACSWPGRAGCSGARALGGAGAGRGVHRADAALAVRARLAAAADGRGGAGEGGLTGNRWSFLPFAAWDVGLVPGVVLAGLGLWALLRSDALRPWRAIGIGSVVTTAR